MNTHPLFNLDLGPTRTDIVSSFRVGPFLVTLVDEYDERIRAIPHNASATRSYEADEDEGKFTRKPASGRGWHVTAVATLDGPGEDSVIATTVSQDGGLWDLCNILTFLTGRRVCTEPDTEYHSAKTVGARACLPIRTPAMAAAVWSAQQRIADKKLGTAFCLYNEAMSQNMIQVIASLHNTALNAVLDRWSPPPVEASAFDRKAFKKAVSAVVDSTSGLSDSERDGYRAKLGAAVDQGLLGQLDKLLVLLIDLGIVPAETALHPKEMTQRIKYINTARNRLTHTGTTPTLPGLTEEQSKRQTAAIAMGVVPSIVVLAMERVLGFVDGPERLHSAHRRDLEAFFREGLWRDWPINLSSFEEWLDSSPANTADGSFVRPVRPHHSQIAEAAYFRWLGRGCHDGNAADDWVAAERALGAPM